MLLNLLPLLQEAGWRQTVVSLLSGGELQDEYDALAGGDLSIETLNVRKSSPISFLQGYAHLHRIMKRQPPGTIVQGGIYHGNVAALVAVPFLAKPRHLVWGIHAAGFKPEDFSFASRSMLKASRFFSDKSPDKIIYCSQQARDDHESLGFAARQGYVIENGVDTTLLRDIRKGRAEARKRLDIANGDYVLACIARYTPQKDIPNLFAAVQAIQPNKRPVILMVGGGVSFDNPDFLADFNASGLTRDTCRIMAVGLQNNPFDYLAAADALVLPSSFGEAQPLAVLESLAAGIPVIATSVGGVPELAQRLGEEGAVRLVSAKTPELLAKAIVVLQEELSDISEKTRVNWQKNVEKYYGIARVAAEYDAVYRSLILPR